MLTLRHLFLAWLVVAVLGYATAVAVDMHTVLSVQSQMLDMDSETHEGDFDHCYHGSAHLLGLSFQIEMLHLYVEPHVTINRYRFSFPTPLPDYLLRPPISV